MNKKTRMMQRITEHGRDIIALFPTATEQDPVNLCRKLRRLEAQAHALTVDCCNGAFDDGEDGELLDIALEKILAKVRSLLNLTPGKALEVGLFVNRDPRGYALKLDSHFVHGLTDAGGRIHRDWGGYGILAPDLTND